MNKSVVAAYNAYPLTNENKCNNEINARRLGFQQGYEQAEKEYKNQWVSVDEALPEYDEDVIVTNGKGDYWFSYRPTYDDVIVDRNGFNNPSNLNITHWMPIPILEGGTK